MICVALKSFDSGPLWWIGYYIYTEGEEGTTLDDVDTHENVASLFEGTRPIETHRPKDVFTALSRPMDIARKEQLPLYRVNPYTGNNGSQREIYEAM